MRPRLALVALGVAALAIGTGCAGDDTSTSGVTPQTTGAGAADAEQNPTATAADADPSAPGRSTDGTAAAGDPNDPPEAGDPNGDNNAQPDNAQPDNAQPDNARTVDGAWVEVDYTLVPVLSADQPTVLTPRPGSDQLWLAERRGTVRRLTPTETTTDGGAAPGEVSFNDETVLDLSDRISTSGEGGLLGMVFAPDGRHLYVHYTDGDGDTVVSELPVASDTADRNAERVLLQLNQPFANHNGGQLAMGPDELLYIGLGDGGSGGDPKGNGQNRSTLLGSILRLDPRPDTTSDAPYRLPADNPFIGSAEGFRPEIWVYGVRNPWRFSFDRTTGDLWVADVGQNEREEITHLPTQASNDGSAGRGANLGWNLVEADQTFAGDPPPDHVPPLYAYGHDDGGCSITGGFVHRGKATAVLNGVYLFSDYCAGGLQGLAPAADGGVVVDELRLDRQPALVIGFGQGHTGEIYVLEQDGQVSLITSDG